MWRRTREARPTPDKSRQGETTGSDDELRREAPPALWAGELPASRGRASCQGCPCPAKLQRRPAVISKLWSCWELSSRIAVCRDRFLGRGVGSNSCNRRRRSLSVGCFLLRPDCLYTARSPVSRRRDVWQQRGFDSLVSGSHDYSIRLTGEPAWIVRSGQADGTDPPLDVPLFLFTFFFHPAATRRKRSLGWMYLAGSGSQQAITCSCQLAGGAGQPT